MFTDKQVSRYLHIHSPPVSIYTSVMLKLEALSAHTLKVDVTVRSVTAAHPGKWKWDEMLSFLTAQQLAS